MVAFRPVLTDGDAIRNLLGRYCDLMDRADWPAVGELFGAGRLAAEDGGVLASGADEVTEFYRRGTQLHDGSPRTKHLVLNTELSFAGDEAVARSSYLVLQAIDDVLPLQPIITGRYLDRFARRDDGTWYFTERRYYVDQLGDLSQHQAHLPG